MKNKYKVAGMEFKVKYVNSWQAPSVSDAQILTMPNIPHQLHGRGCQPRTILGPTTWDIMRKRCYYNADYRCEACGKDLDRGQCQAHELFSYDYIAGKAKFERCVCLCRTCHLQGVHSGRLLTLYKKGQASIRQVLEGAENLFKNISEWSEKHPSEPELRAFYAWLDFLKIEDIREDMLALIDKYKVKFYAPTKEKAGWGEWSVIVGSREFQSPYKNEAEWRAAMEEQNPTKEKSAVEVEQVSDEEIAKKLENWA